MKRFIAYISCLASLLSAGTSLSAQETATFYKMGEGENTKLFLVDNYIYPRIVLDSAIMRVNYGYRFVSDTTEEKVTSGKSTLEVGRNFTKYYDYYNFETDSIAQFRKNTPYLGNGKNLKIADPDMLFYYESFIHDLKKGKWTCTGRVGIQNMLYTESVEKIEWNIIDSTAVIEGYNAVMATCSFRGRDYTAWFTMDLPIQAGPWKFSGLPGLILSICDSEGYYSFHIESIYPVKCAIFRSDYLYLKMKRKDYMEITKLYRTNFSSTMERFMEGSSLQWTTVRARITPLGNDLIERDLKL